MAITPIPSRERSQKDLCKLFRYSGISDGFGSIVDHATSYASGFPAVRHLHWFDHSKADEITNLLQQTKYKLDILAGRHGLFNESYFSEAISNLADISCKFEEVFLPQNACDNSDGYQNFIAHMSCVQEGILNLHDRLKMFAEQYNLPVPSATVPMDE